MEMKTRDRPGGGVSGFDVNEHLWLSAKRISDRVGLVYDAPFEHEWKIQIHEAVVRMEREGRLDDPESIARAEQGAILIMEAIVDLAVAQHTQRVVRAFLDEALRKLCPVWPFC